MRPTGEVSALPEVPCPAPVFVPVHPSSKVKAGRTDWRSSELNGNSENADSCPCLLGPWIRFILATQPVEQRRTSNPPIRSPAAGADIEGLQTSVPDGGVDRRLADLHDSGGLGAGVHLAFEGTARFAAVRLGCVHTTQTGPAQRIGGFVTPTIARHHLRAYRSRLGGILHRVRSGDRIAQAHVAAGARYEGMGREDIARHIFRWSGTDAGLRVRVAE